MNEIGFARPGMLWLLLLLPVLVGMSLRSLAGLGRYRRVFAVGLRCLTWTALVLALAELQWRDLTNRLTVLYLLDQSESIPREQRDAMLAYVKSSVERHRRAATDDGAGDRAGVIIFGASAKMEAAPYEGDLPLVDRLESDFDLQTDATNLEAALRLAKATFPEDTARRVVVVTDGNQNRGDARSLASSLARDGIGIDVVPVKLEARSDVAIEKLMVPSDIRNGQKFEARVVLVNETVPTPDRPGGEISGRLTLTQKIDQREEKIAEQSVTLQPGKNVISFTHELDQSAIVTFRAQFVADDPSADSILRNNEASAFAQVRGLGRVLLVEDASAPGEFARLVETLQQAKIQVDLRDSSDPFSSAAELLQYDSVILGNVSRASEDATGNAVAFTDNQIRTLVDNCEDLGCGLVMIGGDRSFGAGGWSNTELEKAMPVDFQIKNDKINAVGALVMIMHASELANGNYWQVKIGQEALGMLGPMDYCGVVDWSDFGAAPRWLWYLPSGLDRVGDNRRRMQSLMGRMIPGDMMDFDTPMRLALGALVKCPASMKHMIVISDGDPSPPSPNLLNQFSNAKIKISTVAVGTHGPAGSSLLQDIAQKTGGKYYEVKDPRALPRIFQREARRVGKPVVKESATGMRAIPLPAANRHEILLGMEASQFRPFLGYVMTTVKKNALVEQLLVASDPADNLDNTTLLATWRYGVGRAVVFTSDAGFKWCSDWYGEDYYQKLFTQMVRYSMRPVTQDANFALGTDIRNNRVRVVVTAMNDDDEFINFLNLNARGIRPDASGFDLNFSQTAPGRYEAEFETNTPGNYLYSIFPGEGYERLTSGVSVPYSSEYSDRTTNDGLIDALVSLAPRGSRETGQRAPRLTDRQDLEAPLTLNPFRADLSHAAAIESMWPLLIVCGAWVFLTDIFIRRVAVNFAFLVEAGRRAVKGWKGEPDTQVSRNLERLQSRKSEINRQLEANQRGFGMPVKPDSTGSTISGKEHLARVLGQERDQEVEVPVPQPLPESPEKDQTVPHTSRLLDAKRRARKSRDD